MAEVCRQGDNTLSARTVPIIFVPGVMGSKLHFPDPGGIGGGEDWDPDSNYAMSHWISISAEDARWEMGFEATATVFDQDPPPNKGFNSVAQGFYRGFLDFLTGLQSLCAKTPVYAVGYDWRQSNLASGAWLDVHITAILSQEKADNFILISHSMGGIVCRSCLRENASGNSDKLLGVIHVFQPVTGAPVFYGRMYTGAVKALDGGFFLAKIMGDTPAKFATILGGLRGPCELIPNEAYSDIDAGGVQGPWLWDLRAGSPEPFPPPMFDRYLDAAGPPGITWSIATTPHSAHLIDRIREARTFHARLGQFRHPRTWALFGTGLLTDVSTEFTSSGKNRGVQRIRRELGDGTVPASSGSALFGASATRGDMTGLVFSGDSSLRQCRVVGVEHSAACGPPVQNVVEQMLLVALGCRGPVKDPADMGIPVPDIPDPATLAMDNSTESAVDGEDTSSDDADSNDADSQMELADATNPEDETTGIDELEAGLTTPEDWSVT